VRRCQNIIMPFPATEIPSKDKFDHSFEGWSVWIEPDEQESADIVKEIESLSLKCGGAESGVFPFLPHCTLLYNISSITDDDDVIHDSTEKLEILLYECVDKFREFADKGHDDATHESTWHPPMQLMLIPSSFYYFAYPKHADNGKGFGCVISLILLENTVALQQLHAAVTATFPRDERRSNFVPHMSLVYAPETKATWLQQYTTRDLECNKQVLLKPLCAKYLSLWSTKGQVNEWYRFCRVQL
jgi:2'-5' RNA ligase